MLFYQVGYIQVMVALLVVHCQFTGKKCFLPYSLIQGFLTIQLRGILPVNGLLVQVTPGMAYT